MSDGNCVWVPFGYGYASLCVEGHNPQKEKERGVAPVVLGNPIILLPQMILPRSFSVAEEPNLPVECVPLDARCSYSTQCSDVIIKIREAAMLILDKRDERFPPPSLEEEAIANALRPEAQVVGEEDVDVEYDLLREAYGIRFPSPDMVDVGQRDLSIRPSPSKTVFLSFPQGLEKEISYSLQEIVKKLWATGKKKSWRYSSAMTELLAEANKRGAASLFISFNGVLKRVIVVKSSETTFTIVATHPELFEDEVSLLKGKRSHDSIELNSFIQSLYQEALGVLRLCQHKTASLTPPKVTVSKILSEEESLFQLSIKNDLVTFGTQTFIGRGAFNTAMKILRIDIHRRIYTKCTPTTLNTVALLRYQAKMMRRLSHPHVVGFIEFSDKIVPSLKMEYCRFGTAERFTMSPPKTRVEVAERLKFFYHGALGVAYIHGLPGKLAHMDVKPNNLLVTTEGGIIVGKLGDTCLWPEGSQAISTLWYVDAESILLRIGPYFISNQACDVWALAICLFEFMYGREKNPIESVFGNPQADLEGQFKLYIQKLRAILVDEVIGKEINDLLRDMLIFDRASRVTLSGEFLQKIESALHHL